MDRPAAAPGGRWGLDLRGSAQAARSGSERRRRAGLPAAPEQHRPDGRPAAAGHRDRRRRDARDRPADPRSGGDLRVLFVAFIIGIASVWARGINIDCGCFGGGGADPDAASQYPWEIARDVGLLAASLVPGLAAVHPAVAGLRPVSPYRHVRRNLMSKKNRANDRAGRAAAALAEQQRQERRRRNIMIGGVVGVILVIVLAGFFAAAVPRHHHRRQCRRPELQQRLRCDHRAGRRAQQGRHLRGLPLPLLRRAREADPRRPRAARRRRQGAGRVPAVRPPRRRRREELLRPVGRRLLDRAGQVDARGRQEVPRPPLREPARRVRPVPEELRARRPRRRGRSRRVRRTLRDRGRRGRGLGDQGHQGRGRRRGAEHADHPAQRRGLPGRHHHRRPRVRT